MYDSLKARKKVGSLPNTDHNTLDKNLKSGAIEINYSECLGNEEEEEASSQKDEGFVENIGYDMVENQKTMKVTSLTMLEFAQQISAGMVSSSPSFAHFLPSE